MSLPRSRPNEGCLPVAEVRSTEARTLNQHLLGGGVLGGGRPSLGLVLLSVVIASMLCVSIFGNAQKALALEHARSVTLDQDYKLALKVGALKAATKMRSGARGRT